MYKMMETANVNAVLNDYSTLGRADNYGCNLYKDTKKRFLDGSVLVEWKDDVRAIAAMDAKDYVIKIAKALKSGFEEATESFREDQHLN